jgi:capsular exopolysaccharide synthesis family protein
VIVTSVVIASLAAWGTTVVLDAPEVAVAPRKTFNATTTLLNTEAPTIGQGLPIPDPATLVGFVALPEVASIAERALDTQGDSTAGDPQVYATVDPVTGMLSITGTATSPERAVAVSRAYSHSLITYLERLKQKKLTLQEQKVQEQIQKLRRRGSGGALIPTLRSTLSQLELYRTTPVPLAIFRASTAVPAAATPVQTQGVQVPESLPLRVALAALFGLLAGLVLALVLERFDTRIRSPRAAEEAFGFPVLAEVPAISRGRRRSIVTASHPSSRAADVFRLVGVGTARWSSNGNGSGNGRVSRAKTLLVTSPEARDGKTTVAANLAVAHAQAGSRVLVVSCDLRRPAIHEAFGVDEAPGLVDLLERTTGDADPASEPDLARYLEPCSVVRIAVVPSGLASEHPGELLGSAKMQRFLERLKKITDVIILDCAPLVVASDVVPLLPQADGVVVVARARKTRRELAASTAALLERLGTTTAGVVLNDAREFSIPLAKRRMYRPTRKMRKAARRNPPPRTEEPSKLDPFVEDAATVDVRPRSAGSGEGNGSGATVVVDQSQPAVHTPEASTHRRQQMLVAERTVQSPPAQEAQEQAPERSRPRTPDALQSLQDELVELRAQLEGLQLELPDIAMSPGSDRSTADPGDDR